MPIFEGLDPQGIALAQAAWEAGVDCTGWVPKHKALVRFQVGEVSGGFAGRAYVGSAGLERIKVKPGWRPRTIFHEVAHAWVHGGPSALAEGRTNLLADCMVTRAEPHEDLDIRRDRGQWLADMPSLRDWGNADDVRSGERTDGYTAASRYAQALAEFLPHGTLWPGHQLRSWGDLDLLLAGRGPEVDRLLALLDEEPARQRLALTDLDGDGLVTVLEELWGLDPETADSDGDGWPDGLDGSRIPDRALHLANDGKVHCSGFEHAPEVTPTWTVGTRRGTRSDLSPLAEHGDGTLLEAPALLALDGTRLWVAADPGALVPSTRCLEDRRVLVHTTDTAYADLLEPLRDSLGLDGPGPWRLDIRLGTPETRFGPARVELSAAHVDASLIAGHRGLGRLVRLFWVEAQDREEALTDLLATFEAQRVQEEAAALQGERSDRARQADLAQQAREWEARQAREAEARLAQEARDGEAVARATRERRTQERYEREAREARAQRAADDRAAAELEAKRAARERAARLAAAEQAAAEAAARQRAREAQEAEHAAQKAALRQEWDQWLANAAEQRRRDAEAGVRRFLHPVELGPRPADAGWTEDFEEANPCALLLAESALPAGARCDGQAGVLVVPVWSGVRKQTVETVAADTIGNPSAPVRIALGTATTGLTDTEVQLARSEVTWAQRQGREDVLAALASVLVGYLEMGIPLDPAAVNDELAIEVGYGVRTVVLEAPAP